MAGRCLSRTSITRSDNHLARWNDDRNRNFENTTALTANTRAFVFAYHDPVANQVGISINGGAFATASYSGGIHNSTSTVNVGVSKSSGAVANYHSGKVHVAATGLPSSQPSSWSAIRDAIYNSGSPLTYDQLTPTQLSDWGVQAWYDCDEWGLCFETNTLGLISLEPATTPTTLYRHLLV